MPQYTPAELERTTVDRFQKWTQLFREQQGVPVICIGVGHVGVKRSEPAPIYCFPADLQVDWLINSARTLIEVLEAKKARGG